MPASSTSIVQRLVALEPVLWPVRPGFYVEATPMMSEDGTRIVIDTTYERDGRTGRIVADLPIEDFKAAARGIQRLKYHSFLKSWLLGDGDGPALLEEGEEGFE